jgi:hypothetical protein
MNYNDKKFRPISNTENGETSSQTVFHYNQVGNLLTSEYSGGKIKYGHLVGLVDEAGNIDGYFGLTMPVISVKPCHFERSSKVG